MKDNTPEVLQALFEQNFGEKPTELQMLPASGSARKYLRLSSKNHRAIGTFGADVKENETFLQMAKFFASKQLRVPQVYGVSADRHCYLQEDFGNQSLLHLLQSKRRDSVDFPKEVEDRYANILQELLEWQLEGSKGLDFSICYPEAKFDRIGILKDLRYFKSYFLHVSEIPYSERAIEADFERLAAHCLSADDQYFVYRDFQSRNIMIVGEENAYIDFQGGRQGPLAYDVVSLLFQARAGLPKEAKERLLNHYVTAAHDRYGIDPESILDTFNSFVWVRVLQTLGAYGFRGIIQRKEHFLKSIPPALENLKSLLDTYPGSAKLECLPKLLNHLLESDWCQQFKPISRKASPLTVDIKSFSYKRALPSDPSGNGGGFIFDCRHLYNPGRYEEYKQLTGHDKSVQVFLETKSKLPQFLKDVYSTVDRAVEKYIDRGFENLQVSFGCTGGRHRSVYSAEQLKKHLLSKYPIKVEIQHIERELEAKGL